MFDPTSLGAPGQYRVVLDEVRALCAALDPDALPAPSVGPVFDTLVVMRRLVDGAITRLAPRYERCGVWQARGAKSAADGIAASTGTSPADAQRRLHTGRKLRDQSRLDAALRAGEVSSEQAEVIAGAAGDPEAETKLIDAAKTLSHRELRDEAAREHARSDRDEEARRARQRRLRCVKRWTDADGMYNLLLRVLPEVGADIDAYLAPLVDAEFAAARKEDRRESVPAYVADVVADLLRGAGSSVSGASGGGVSGASGGGVSGGGVSGGGVSGASGGGVSGASGGGVSGASGGRARAAAGAVRPERKVIALVDINALNRGIAEGAEVCEIAGVGPVSVAAVRAMFGDAAMAVVFRDGVDIRSVVHLGRQVTAAQRTALEARGPRCSIVGCGSTHRLEIDHTVGWAYTRTTHIDDLDWLCSTDHHHKTRHNLLAIGPPGHRVLVERDPTNPTQPRMPLVQVRPAPADGGPAPPTIPCERGPGTLFDDGA